MVTSSRSRPGGMDRDLPARAHDASALSTARRLRSHRRLNMVLGCTRNIKQEMTGFNAQYCW